MQSKKLMVAICLSGALLFSACADRKFEQSGIGYALEGLPFAENLLEAGKCDPKMVEAAALVLRKAAARAPHNVVKAVALALELALRSYCAKKNNDSTAALLEFNRRLDELESFIKEEVRRIERLQRRIEVLEKRLQYLRRAGCGEFRYRKAGTSKDKRGI